MLRRLLTPDPGSVIVLCARGPKARWAMLWNLVWVPWMFGDLLFGMAVPRHWWPVTLATLAVFLVLYACVNLRPAREVPAYALALVAVACAVMPTAQFASGTCLIYACVFLSLRPTLPRTLAWILPVMAAWALDAYLLQWPWQAMLWIIVISLAASVGQHSMWANLRKNAELRLSHEEIRRLAASAERERIGRDLHDLLGHTLSMVALKSELAGRLIERDPAAARREMAEVEHVARAALAQVRSAVSGIRAAVLASEFASARLLLETSGVRMDYWSDGHELPAPVETCLAMVLREAVTNIERHAHASRVEASVAVADACVTLRIRDDGRGGAGARGNGLTGMQERVAACGGELAVDSPQGKGTTVEVRLPLPPVPARRRDSGIEAAPAVAALADGRAAVGRA